MSPRDYVLPLPLPRASTVERDAISAAEALLSLRRSDELTPLLPGYDIDIDGGLWSDGQEKLAQAKGVRNEEAQAALRILAAALVDDTGDESDERAITVRSMAGRLHLYDLEGFEARCREIAAEVTRG